MYQSGKVAKECTSKANEFADPSGMMPMFEAKAPVDATVRHRAAGRSLIHVHD
jgi:hypothetical protein